MEIRIKHTGYYFKFKSLRPSLFAVYYNLLFFYRKEAKAQSVGDRDHPLHS